MNIRSLALTLAITSLAIAGTTGCSSKEEREQKYLDRARVLIEEGDLTKAGLEVRNVLQINQFNAEALYLRGLIHEANENYSKMMDSFNEARSADPAYVPVLLKLSYYYYNFGEAADEITQEALDRVFELEPENLTATITMGKMALRRGENEEAATIAKRAATAHPGSIEPIILFAAIYKDTPDKALELLDTGLSANPGNPELLLSRFSILNEQGDTDGAVQTLKVLTDSNPEELTYFQQLLNYLKGLERPQESEELIRARIAAYPDEPQYKVWLARQLIETGQSQLAIDTIKGYVEADPTIVEYHYLLSDIYLSQKDTESALAVLDAFSALVPSNSQELLTAANRSADIALQAGNRDSAKHYLDKVFEIDPEDAAGLITRAKLALLESDTEAAVLSLRTAIRHNRESAEAHILLATAHEADGAMDLALENYQQAIVLEPGNTDVVMKVADIYYNRDEPGLANRLLLRYLQSERTARVVAPRLVSSYVEQSKWMEATEVVETLEKQRSNTSLALFLKGELLYQQGDFESALSAYRELLEAEPGSPRVIASIVKTLGADGEHEQAVEYLQAYIKENPNELAPYEILAAVYAQKGDTAAALAAYEKALEILPDNPNVYVKMSQVHQGAGNFTEALASLEKAIAIQPTNPSLSILKAGLLEADSRHDEAAAMYESLLDKGPNTIAANNLAMIYVDHYPSEANVARAVEITIGFEEANEPVLLDTRGWVLYRAAQYENALPLLEKAVSRLRDGNPVYYYHLGMAYLKLGETDKARDTLETALETEGLFAEREQASEALASIQDE